MPLTGPDTPSTAGSLHSWASWSLYEMVHSVPDLKHHHTVLFRVQREVSSNCCSLKSVLSTVNIQEISLCFWDTGFRKCCGKCPQSISFVKKQFFRQEDPKTLILRDNRENVAPVLQVSDSSLQPTNNSVREAAWFSAELCIPRAHLQCRLWWRYPS